MKRPNFLWYLIVVIALPIAITVLSANLVLRVSETYMFHFNDSQVVDKINTSVTASEIAEEITGYFNSASKEEFQVYEENGIFNDPIFPKEDVEVMAKIKQSMTVWLITGVVMLAIGLIAYFYLYAKSKKSTLKYCGLGGIGLSLFSVLGLDYALTEGTARTWLYNNLVGIPLGRESLVKRLMMSPFEKSFMLFFSILSGALIILAFYLNYHLTREKKFFFGK